MRGILASSGIGIGRDELAIDPEGGEIGRQCLLHPEHRMIKARRGSGPSFACLCSGAMTRLAYALSVS